MKYKFRPALFSDSDWIRDFANMNRKYSINTSEINKEDHERWFFKHKGEIQVIYNPDNYDDVYGTIRQDNAGFIHIYLYEKYQNKGIGTDILSKMKGKSIILYDNIASQKAFLNAGFEIKGFLLMKGE